MSLVDKNILLGVTGGIAAYKSAELVRELARAGARVRVVMTRTAQEFVTPLTFQALSGHPVATDDQSLSGFGMDHIELARWADAILIAPASANTLAKLARGICDNLLTTICLCTDAPLAVAPAMNVHMWGHETTQENCALLGQRNVQFFGPADGSQACGDVGEGRMFESHQLLAELTKLFSSDVLNDVAVLITAGPTHETIDPVRYIGNRSSGKMGCALAAATREAGAQVLLISGPVQLETPLGVDCLRVVTATQMQDAVLSHVARYQIFIGCAAVADYRPLQVAPSKIKKTEEQISLPLVRNPDILAAVASLEPRPFVVGFAAETENSEHHAKQKLVAKKLDMIAVNDVSKVEIGFESDFNELHVYWETGQKYFARDRKTKIARDLIQLIAQRYRSTYYPSNVASIKKRKN